jgi:hypothetical protein
MIRGTGWRIVSSLLLRGRPKMRDIADTALVWVLGWIGIAIMCFAFGLLALALDSFGKRVVRLFTSRSRAK